MDTLCVHYAPNLPTFLSPFFLLAVVLITVLLIVSTSLVFFGDG